MACLDPLTGWRGKTQPDHKRPIVFSPRQAEDPSTPLDIPCGKCDGCLATASREWGIRCYHESTQHDRNAFVTLTYDDEHYPEDGKISVDILQNFIKRLREQVKPAKLRYFACGEYGELTRRPHYHLLVFGMDFRGGEEIINEQGDYSSQIIANSWDKGHNMCANVSPASCFYVAGYETKKIGDPDIFKLQSRRPAIGRAFTDKYIDEIANMGKIVIGGREWPIPAVYFQWHPEKLLERQKEAETYNLSKDFHEKWEQNRHKIKAFNSKKLRQHDGTKL
ncbi:replication initiator protein [Microviridae sp.]|nr:replication initiator protein [Microviridae sp.]